MTTNSRSMLWMAMPPTAFLSLATLLTYLLFRLIYLATAPKAIRNHPHEGGTIDPLRTFVLPWLFFGLELLVLLPNAIPYVLRIIAIKPAHHEKQQLFGSDVPSVDVLITTCNEDLQVVMDTIKAACVLDYPTDRYRVFVCDDGNSARLQDAVRSHAARYSHLHYTARVKGPVQDFKAGNLNHGLAYSASIDPLAVASLPRLCRILPASNETLVEDVSSNAHKDLETNVADLSIKKHLAAANGKDLAELRSVSVSEHSACSSTSNLELRHAQRAQLEAVPWGQYIAGLDADMIPMPDWLHSLLPYIEKDTKCAMVCPPQTFYDIPPNDPLTQTMSHFAGMTEAVNDALGHADCLGSGYIMRRIALESIGGYPTESLSEDVCCSATLLGAGWKTVFVPEAVQYGSVPESYLAHVKQRTRWWIGHIQTALLFRLRMGSRANGLKIQQRLTGFAFDLRQIVQIPTALSYLIVPFVLLSGSPLVFWATRHELRVLIRLVSIWSFTHWSHNGIMGALASSGNDFVEYDVRMASYDSEMEQWLSPYYLVAFMRSFILPKTLGGAKTGFKASGSISNDLNERSRQHRAPLLRRLRIALFSHLVIVHVLFVTACIAGVALNFARAFSPRDIPNLWSVTPLISDTDRIIFLVTRIGWPPLLWLQFVASALTPIAYTISPPDQPEREELLDRDTKTGVAYPKADARTPRRTMKGWWRYGRGLFAILWTITVFLANEAL